MKKYIFSGWFLPILMALLFLSVALVAEQQPAHKYYFCCEFRGMEAFFRLDRLDISYRYWLGNSIHHHRSLLYLVLLKGSHFFISDRLLAMRAISLVCGTAGLMLSCRLGALLFQRPVGILMMWLLVTNPTYIEGMRAFGYHSISHLLALAVMCLGLVTARDRVRPLLLLLLAVCSYLFLSVYVIGRLSIVLVLVWYLFSGKKGWLRLLLFLGMFGAIVLLFDTIAGGSGFSPLSFFSVNGNREWMNQDGALSLAQMRYNASLNIPKLVGYMGGINRVPLTSNNPHSYLFSPVYTLFWVIGLLVCVKERRREQVFVLLMLLFFVLVPLASNGISPRRMMFALYPLGLLIALGLWRSNQMIAALLARQVSRRVVSFFFFGLIFVFGIFNLHTFFCSAAPPPYPVLPGELKAISEFILEKEALVSRIVFPMEYSAHIWGNRYLANRVTPRLNYKLRTLERGNGQAVGSFQLSLQKGQPFLMIYPLSPPGEFQEVIEWADHAYPGAVSSASIPGTGAGYSIFTPPAEIAPNLLSSESPGVQVSGSIPDFPSPDPGVLFLGIPRDIPGALFLDVLTDMDPTSSEEIISAQSGEPPWMILDFGPGNSRSIAAVMAVPAEDPARPELFVKAIKVSSSEDGKLWREMGRVANTEQPMPGRQYRWELPDFSPKRYLKLEFTDLNGEPVSSVFLGDLVLYEHR